MHSRFQAMVYKALIQDIGLHWPDIEKKLDDATEGRDVLVSARIRNEIANLVEMCVRLDKNAVIVTGFEEPLINGDLFLHPLTKELCVVGQDGQAPEPGPKVAPNRLDSDMLRKIGPNTYLCKRFGVWFRVVYADNLRYEHFHSPKAHFGHVDFVKENAGLKFDCEALNAWELKYYKLAS